MRTKYSNAKVAAKYDDRGNQIETSYFDEAGKPTRHTDGNHKFTAKYDDRANQIETAYFDKAGKPVRIKDGYAKSTSVFDDRGNRIETSYFDEAGKPTRHTDGNHKFTIKFDDRGNAIETAYFDKAGKPVRFKNDFTRMTKSYDAQGRVIRTTYYGLDADARGYFAIATDVIDLYLSHWPDMATPFEETLGAYQRLIEQGKIRWCGASNLNVAMLEAALAAAKAKGRPRYEVLQPEYNLADRAGI